MEFEDEDREDEQEEEDDDYDDEDEGITIPPPSTTQTQTYDSSSTPNIFTTNHRKVVTAVGDPTATTTSAGIRYRECLKNHAVNIGGHAVDGCGEFMPAGADGTLEALKCAACGCHRNFHRKEQSLDFLNSSPAASNPPLYPQFTASPYYHAQPHPFQVVAPPPPPPPHMSTGHQHHYHRALALPSTSGGYGTSRSGDQEMDEMSNPSSSGGGGSMGKSKRFRTKFTQEQKDRMFEFAEKVGWRIQKHDEAAVQQFCQEVGVRRQVLKVWMHNNKNSVGSGRKNPVTMA